MQKSLVIVAHSNRQAKIQHLPFLVFPNEKLLLSVIVNRIIRKQFINKQWLSYVDLTPFNRGNELTAWHHPAHTITGKDGLRVVTVGQQVIESILSRTTQRSNSATTKQHTCPKRFNTYLVKRLMRADDHLRLIRMDSHKFLSLWDPGMLHGSAQQGSEDKRDRHLRHWLIMHQNPNHILTQEHKSYLDTRTIRLFSTSTS